MKKLSHIFTLFLILFFTGVFVYPQTHHLSKSFNPEFKHETKLSLSLPIKIDSLELNNIYAYNKIPYSNFFYAGHKRFTISGELPNFEKDINPFRAGVVSGVSLVTIVALHINQNVAWWSHRGRPFYIRDDWNNALQADKLGHFMGGYFTSYFAREGLVYAGFGWDESIFWGSVFGIISQTYVEIKDGFAQNTGFSPTDFVADILGSGYFYVQHYVPFLQNFTPKWQYTPPGLIGVPLKMRTQTFLDNYNATTAWWSVDVHNLLPHQYRRLWPNWLNLALGYGINGYYSPHKTRRFLIGIDFNLVELLPDGGSFWNWFKQTFNYFKLPLPAVEFTNNGTRFYLFYPFQINVGRVKF